MNGRAGVLALARPGAPPGRPVLQASKTLADHKPKTDSDWRKTITYLPGVAERFRERPVEGSIACPLQGFAIHNYAIVINGLPDLRDGLKRGETHLLFRGHAQTK